MLGAWHRVGILQPFCVYLGRHELPYLLDMFKWLPFINPILWHVCTVCRLRGRRRSSTHPHMYVCFDQYLTQHPLFILWTTIHTGVKAKRKQLGDKISGVYFILLAVCMLRCWMELHDSNSTTPCYTFVGQLISFCVLSVCWTWSTPRGTTVIWEQTQGAEGSIALVKWRVHNHLPGSMLSSAPCVDPSCPSWPVGSHELHMKYAGKLTHKSKASLSLNLVVRFSAKTDTTTHRQQYRIQAAVFVSQLLPLCFQICRVVRHRR